MAGALAQRFGVGPGDRVALLMANRPEYLTLVNATWWVGAAIAPVNYRLHAREVAWMVADCEAKLVIADEALAGELKALLAADAREQWCAVWRACCGPCAVAINPTGRPSR